MGQTETNGIMPQKGPRLFQGVMYLWSMISIFLGYSMEKARFSHTADKNMETNGASRLLVIGGSSIQDTWIQAQLLSVSH